MKYVHVLIALLAVAAFVVPATSMQEDGIAMNNCKPQIQDERQCDCPNADAAPVNQNCVQKPIMGDGPKAPLGQNYQMGSAEDNAPRSMMGSKCDRSMMKPMGNEPAPKSMMEGKMPLPCEPKAVRGPDENAGPKSMMEGKMPSPCEPKAVRGPGENAGPKSMMEGKMPSPCDQNKVNGPMPNPSEQGAQNGEIEDNVLVP